MGTDVAQAEAAVGARRNAPVQFDLQRLQLPAPEGVLVGNVADPLGAGALRRRLDSILSTKCRHQSAP